MPTTSTWSPHAGPTQDAAPLERLGWRSTRRALVLAIGSGLLASRCAAATARSSESCPGQDCTCECGDLFCFKTAWGTAQPFGEPCGLAMAPDGALLIVDKLPRVVRIDPDRNEQEVWPSSTGLSLAFPSDVAIAPDGTVYLGDAGSRSITVIGPDGAIRGRWGKAGTGKGEFAGLLALAVAPDGIVYVADTDNRRVQFFSPDGAYLGQWGRQGSGPGDFDFPLGVAVAPDGTVYVTDEDNQRVQAFLPDGTFLREWGKDGGAPGEFRLPWGIAVGSDGTIYVVDQYNARIQVFDKDGTFLRMWGEQGSSDGQFDTPYAVAVGPDERVYVADGRNRRVQAFDPDGTHRATWGGASALPGRFNKPNALTAGPDGSVYVLDYWNSRVEAFSADGSFLHTWGEIGAGNGQFNRAGGIAAAANGSIYVADQYNDRIQVFDRAGAYLGQWGATGTEPGQFQFPSSIAVGRDGTVYVLDNDNDRVQVFDGAGRLLRVWPLAAQASGLTILPDGRILVADREGAILVFSHDGTALGSWRDEAIPGPSGITSTPDGRIVYVIDSTAHAVAAFTAEGARIGRLGTIGVEPGQFFQPNGIAIAADGRSLYVADTFNDRIQAFCVPGALDRRALAATPGPHDEAAPVSSPNQSCATRSWGSPSGVGNLGHPNGVAVASDGTLFVADRERDQVVVFDQAGSLKAAWPYPSSGDPPVTGLVDVALASDGTLYTIEQGGRVRAFGKDGVQLRSWGSPGSGDGEFRLPHGIAIGPNDDVFVADTSNHRIQVFSPEGAYLRQWGFEGRGPGAFKAPESLAVTSNGTVYVADAGNHRLQFFTSGGRYLGQWATTGRWLMDGPMSVAVAPDGQSVYMTLGLSDEIWLFDGGGTAPISVNGAGGAPLRFGEPSAVAVGPDGTIYVSDPKNQRVLSVCR
jgi:tripartite motif-containing protein 71